VVRPPGPRSFHIALRLTNAASFLFNSSTSFFLLLPIYLQQSGSSPAQIGLVAGLLRAGSLVARPVGGRLLDRLGRRHVIGAGAILATLAILSLFLFPRIGAPFLLMRVLQGVGASLIDSGLGAVVADLSPPGARAQVFAIYTVWINLAGAIMPGAGEAIVFRGGFFALFGAAAMALAAGFVLVLRLPETARPRAEQPESLRGIMAGSGPFLLGGLIVGLAFGTLSTFVPVARIAASPGRVGMFFFAYSFGLVVVRLAGGLGISRLAHPSMLLPAYGVIAAGLAALPLGNSALLLVLVGLCCGAGHGVVMPVLYALLLFGMPRDRRGWGVALLAAAYDMGVVLGTMGLGLVAEWVGYRGIFGLAAAAIVLGAGAAQVWGHR
jgi:MFS family permease